MFETEVQWVTALPPPVPSTWAIDYLFAGMDPRVSLAHLDHLFILLGKGFTVGECGGTVGGIQQPGEKHDQYNSDT